MTAQPHNRFVSCVVVVEFAVNGNQTLEAHKPGLHINRKDRKHMFANTSFKLTTYFLVFTKF